MALMNMHIKITRGHTYDPTEKLIAWIPDMFETCRARHLVPWFAIFRSICYLSLGISEELPCSLLHEMRKYTYLIEHRKWMPSIRPHFAGFAPILQAELPFSAPLTHHGSDTWVSVVKLLPSSQVVIALKFEQLHHWEVKLGSSNIQYMYYVYV